MIHQQFTWRKLNNRPCRLKSRQFFSFLKELFAAIHAFMFETQRRNVSFVINVIRYLEKVFLITCAPFEMYSFGWWRCFLPWIWRFLCFSEWYLVSGRNVWAFTTYKDCLLFSFQGFIRPIVRTLISKILGLANIIYCLDWRLFFQSW